MLPSRYWLYAFCLLGAATSVMLLLIAPSHDWLYFLLLVFSSLAAIGTLDLLQTRQAVRRNYPILAHFRYALESIGPE
ncbi:MAG TPA: FMN-binding glutamate synthase family protein, partial [Arenimonas sp.]|nr:FMN-binding glutamate synthase family protein [Arenimonas sp.]